MLYKLPILIFIILILGCNDDALDYSKLASFDELHGSVSRYSASISSRNVNWDSLGQVYRAEVSEDLAEEAYFDIIRDLLLEFRDPHISLLSPFESMYSIDYLGYDKNYEAAITNSYLTEIIEHSSQIKSAFIGDSIGYLLCLDFKGDVAVNNDIYTSALSRFNDTKGLIIDLRVNDGGSVYNAQNLLNKLTDENILWHTTQNRTLDGFDEKYEWFVEPDANISYQNNIIVLNGRYTISAGERFAIAATLIDDMFIVGDTTSNTQGSVMGREMLNGWKYTLTFEKCLDPDGINYGGVGIPPDCYIDAGNGLLNNRDDVIEKAIDLL